MGAAVPEGHAGSADAIGVAAGSALRPVRTAAVDAGCGSARGDAVATGWGDQTAPRIGSPASLSHWLNVEILLCWQEAAGDRDCRAEPRLRQARAWPASWLP